MCDHWIFLVLISLMILMLAVLESIHALEKNKGRASNTEQCAPVLHLARLRALLVINGVWTNRLMFRRRMPFTPHLGDRGSGDVFEIMLPV